MKYLFAVFFCLFLNNFVFAAEKIDINTASLENLTKIIHIGEARAREIISLRPFSSLDELSKIKGISKGRIEDIKKQGLAQVGNSVEVNSAETRPPQTAVEKSADAKHLQPKPSQPEKSSASLLSPIAIFTSFASGGIILLLKTKLKT